MCTCCSHKFKANSNSTLLIGDGEIEQKYLNKKEAEQLIKKSTSLRNSHVASYRQIDFTNTSNAEEEYEEEEEEDEEDCDVSAWDC